MGRSWGTYTISLTRLSDNKTVEFVENFESHDGSTEDYSEWRHLVNFIWSDGNYSCNCNRFLFFERACGLTQEEIDAKDPSLEGTMTGCGDYEKYRCDWIRDEETKEIIYEETE